MDEVVALVTAGRVLSQSGNSRDRRADTTIISGRVEMGEDLMVIDIGAEVRVKSPAAAVGPR